VKVNYSVRSDVLYVVLEETEAPCVYIETGNGIVCRMSETNGRVVGVTIRDFLRHVKNNDDLSVPGLHTGLPIEDFLQYCEVSQ